jgi:hypothetical protein
LGLILVQSTVTFLFRLYLFACLACATSCVGVGPPAHPRSNIDSDRDPARPTFTIALPPDVARKLSEANVRPAEGARYLRVTRIDEATGSEGPPIFGAYRLVGNALQFQPEFRLGAAARYRITAEVPGQPTLYSDYRVNVAASDALPPAIERTYPTADALPANLLKFYVHFSRPMRQTDAVFNRIHILDDQGLPVHDPWRRFQQWSDDGKRLTLWIHPGRVKRGVNLREDLGPVLVPGKSYTLQFEPTLDDLSGQPLGKPFSKSFTATAEDHERVLPEKWTLVAPPAGGREPLTITFPKPLDHALLQRLLAVRNAAGQAVEGAVEVPAGETAWHFRPATAWAAGQEYTVEIDPLLEDLAGNTPLRVFDTDMQEAEPKQPPVLKLTFRARDR